MRVITAKMHLDLQGLFFLKFCFNALVSVPVLLSVAHLFMKKCLHCFREQVHLVITLKVFGMSCFVHLVYFRVSFVLIFWCCNFSCVTLPKLIAPIRTFFLITTEQE